MKHILVVDDSKLNLKIAENALKEYFKISTALSGLEALRFLKKEHVDLILLDIEMPILNGIETLMQIKQDDMISAIPVIFLTSITDRDVEARCLTLGAQDFIIKPFYKPAILRRVQRVLELESLRSDLEKQVIEKTKELERLTMQTITTFANAIDAKDNYTKGHSLRVAKYSKLIAGKLGWSELGMRNLFYTALLHDIGKIGIPDYILNKTDKLTDDEYKVIMKHPEIGGHILEDVIVVPYLGIGAYSHHEKYDGTGYPNGTKAEEIPLIGRIIGVADAVDAMMSDRAYRLKLPQKKVISELKRCRGTQFDPLLADIMINILETGISPDEEDELANDNNALLLKVINEYVNFSKIDGLTGLWNRLYLEEKASEMLAKRHITCAFFIMDLDNFKSVNDTWGHVAGDSLLANISVTIQSTIQKTDIACRMGGDEFGIFIFNVINYENAKLLAQKLIRKIWERMLDSHSPSRITASIGIAMSPEDGTIFQDLYRNADKALYHAKQYGKNTFCFYNELETEPLHIQLKNICVNLNTLKNLLVEKDDTKGAYFVNTTEFEKIYQLLQRMSKRSNEMIQIILFTLVTEDDELPLEIELVDGFKRLMFSVKESLRIGDVATKFNNCQYIVLLKGTDTEGCKIVVERIISQYESQCRGFGLKLIFEIGQLT